MSNEIEESRISGDLSRWECVKSNACRTNYSRGRENFDTIMQLKLHEKI